MRSKILIMGTLLLSACGLVPNKAVNVALLNENTTIETNNEYNPKEAFRVVLVGVEDNHGVSGVSVNQQTTARLRQVMLQKEVNIVDVERSVRSKLTSEIELIEAGGVSQYTLPQAANMAVRGEIVSLNIVPKYTERNSYKTDNGSSHTTPAHCTYKANTSGVLVFYRVDPVAKYRSVSFDGSASQDIPGTGCPELSNSQKLNLFSRAIDEGIENADTKVANALARKGYVLAAYKDQEGKKAYYRLSVRPDQGAIPGVGVQFIELRPSPTNNKVDEIPFGEGKVACTNHTEAAYAEVKDPMVIAKIKRNTPIKLKYKDDLKWIEMMKKMFPCNP